MSRIVRALGHDVDRHDLAATHKVAERGEEQRAAAAIRAGLDDEFGLRLEHDLLVDPEVERVLQRLHTEPGRLRPGVRLVEDVVRASDGGAVEPAIEAKASGRQGAARVVLHGQRF